MKVIGPYSSFCVRGNDCGPLGQARAVPGMISRGEIHQALARVSEKSRSFDSRHYLSNYQIEPLVPKIDSMGLIKGKSFLVVGPGPGDYWPILLNDLGLKAVCIDTEKEALFFLKSIIERFGLASQIECVGSYENLDNRVFDYISIFGVLRQIIIDSLRDKPEPEMTEVLKPILRLINPEGSLLLINDVWLKGFCSPLIPDTKTILPLLDNIFMNILGPQMNLHFKTRSDVDVSDFSLSTATRVLERRAGAVYQVEKIVVVQSE